jgi:hypothetical protein
LSPELRFDDPQIEKEIDEAASLLESLPTTSNDISASRPPPPSTSSMKLVFTPTQRAELDRIVHEELARLLEELWKGLQKNTVAAAEKLNADIWEHIGDTVTSTQRALDLIYGTEQDPGGPVNGELRGNE